MILAIKIEDHFFYFSPDDLDKVIQDLEEKQKVGEEKLSYNSQILPVNSKVISKLKNIRDNITNSPELNKFSTKDIKLSRLVAIIKDNIDSKVYEPKINKRSNFKKNIPSKLKNKFIKFPHQKRWIIMVRRKFYKWSSRSAFI